MTFQISWGPTGPFRDLTGSVEDSKRKKQRGKGRKIEQREKKRETERKDRKREEKREEERKERKRERKEREN